MTSSTDTVKRGPTQPLAIRIVRTLVALAALAGLARWGWSLGNTLPTHLTLAFVSTAVAALLWMYVGTPGDPGWGVPPRVVLAGPGRLLVELTILGVAAFAIWTAVSRAASETFLTVAVVLYVVTWDRALWLLRH